MNYMPGVFPEQFIFGGVRDLINFPDTPDKPEYDREAAGGKFPVPKKVINRRPKASLPGLPAGP